MTDLRTELERLVREWRQTAREMWAINEYPEAGDGWDDCADDLEAVLRRTALEKVEHD